MRINQLIKELERVYKEEGDIEVTCTGTTLPDDMGDGLPNVFETTVETLIVKKDNSNLGTRVRLYL